MAVQSPPPVGYPAAISSHGLATITATVMLESGRVRQAPWPRTCPQASAGALGGALALALALQLLFQRASHAGPPRVAAREGR